MGSDVELVRLGLDQTRPPTFLVIGHVTRDKVQAGYRLGGTATYAALTAQSLGERTGIITSAARDLDLDTFVSRGIQVVLLPSAVTTTFENLYSGLHRLQLLHSVAHSLGPGLVPASWRKANVVLLAPVAQEVSPRFIDLFSNSLLGLSAQGWLRVWNADGVVRGVPIPESERVLAKLDVVVASDEDLAFDDSLPEIYSRLVPIFVLTKGAAGATVYVDGQPYETPAFEVSEADPTGAGDAFAAAYLIALSRTGDPVLSAHVAHCTASFVVERPGIEGIPTMGDVRRRLRSRGIQW